MSNRIRLTDSRLPIAANTARTWKQAKKYPRLIYNIAGTVWFDLEEWEKMAATAKGETDGKIQKD